MIKPNKEMRELVDDVAFNAFWQNFDPNQHYNEETKAFVRQLWELVRQLNSEAHLS